MLETAKILIVDDEPHFPELISDALRLEKQYIIHTAKDAETALQLLNSEEFDAVISDIQMQGMGGLGLLQHITNNKKNLPVILMTGYADVVNMQAAIKHGVFDFLRKPFDAADLQVAVSQAVQKRRLLQLNETYLQHLERMVVQKTRELHQANQLLEKNFVNTVLAMMNALEATDIYTKGHSERVTRYSMQMGRQMNLGKVELDSLRMGAALHDLGKIGIYPQLLNKPMSLSAEEAELMKKHPVIGEKIIRPIQLDKAVGMVILQHHECMDGSGYPEGLKGDKISHLARIVAVADAFDALTSTRAYRKQVQPVAAIEEIRRCCGSQFDPECVNVLGNLVEKQIITTGKVSSSQSIFDSLDGV